MVDIGGGDFQAPISPKWLESSNNRYQKSGMTGQQLFEQVSHFYAWYMAWDSKPADHSKTFETLSRIMRIAQISSNGGNFLSSLEEKDAMESFSELSEDLSYGKVNNEEINERLAKILEHLTENNPKAKVASLVTGLEYLISIRNADIVSSSLLTEFKNQFDHIISKIHPNLQDIHAEAIARSLKELVEAPTLNFEEMLKELKEMIKKWLSG